MITISVYLLIFRSRYYYYYYKLELSRLGLVSKFECCLDSSRPVNLCSFAITSGRVLAQGLTSLQFKPLPRQVSSSLTSSSCCLY